MHVSRTCSCDSTVSVHLRHLVSLYFPLKLFFTSSILVLALKMVDASILFNSFMYFGRSPVFQFVFSRRNCIFVFPPLVFCVLCRKYRFSCYGLIYSFLVLCRVSLICSLILVVVSFHPPVVFVSIILVVIFSGCLCSMFSMLNRFVVMMVVMSSSPVSMYSAYIGVDCGTMSIIRIIFSCIWLIFICSLFVVFIVRSVTQATNIDSTYHLFTRSVFCYFEFHSWSNIILNPILRHMSCRLHYCPPPPDVDGTD